MQHSKQLSGYHYKKDGGTQLWQKGYYDHALRLDEDVCDAALYIFANPVRAGLVAEVTDYPFSGSFEWGKRVLEP